MDKVTLPTVEMAWQEEEKIAERGLIQFYIYALDKIVTTDHGVTNLINEITYFLMIHATPLQRCRAAALAYMWFDEWKKGASQHDCGGVNTDIAGS